MENQFIIPGFVIAIGVDEKSVILKEPKMEGKEEVCYKEVESLHEIEYQETPGVYEADLCIDGEKDWHTMEYNEEAYFVNLKLLWNAPPQST